jgi:hypothetical protein
MKSKELIRQLLELDPKGEVEVCVGNHDIWTVDLEPAYYDGRLQVLVRDPELTGKCFDIVGAKYVSKGQKITITSMGVTDVLWDNPDAKIDYSEVEPHAGRYRESDDKTREASRDVEVKVEKDAFHRWMKEKAEAIRPGGEDCRRSAHYHYDKLGLTPKDPVKELPPKKDKDGYEWWPSWDERRRAMWDDTLEVYWNGGWGVRKKGSTDDETY